MQAYTYQAALYCDDCGEKIREEIRAAGNAPDDEGDEYTYDSEDFPKGPYPDGGGEADGPQHCDGCGIFLENDLTEYGIANVEEMLGEYMSTGNGNAEVLRQWYNFYGFNVTR